MAKKIVEVVENNEVTEVATEVVKESKFKDVMTKVGTGIKKHGKKIAGVALVAVAGTVGYVLGVKSNLDDCDYDVEYQDEVVDANYSDVVDAE